MAKKRKNPKTKRKNARNAARKKERIQKQSVRMLEMQQERKQLQL